MKVKQILPYYYEVNVKRTIELQNLDCNCNDCKFLFRDSDRFNKSQEDHLRWQFN